MPNQTMESWIYLAYLHAITSHSLVDPFTGVTGCEQAIFLLQTGNIKSCKPYSKHSLVLLQKIANLSPHREYYPKDKKCMQIVKHNIDIHDYACHDGYYLVVQDLIQKSTELTFLFPNDTKDLPPNTVELVQRSVNRYGNLYTQHARVFFNPPESIPINLPIKPDPQVQLLTNCIRNNVFATCKLDLFFLQDVDLLPNSEIDFYSFQDSWLPLYKMAMTTTNDELWVFTLNSFYYKMQVSLDQLMLLQAIHVNRRKFPNPLDIPFFENTNEFEVDEERLSELLDEYLMPFDAFLRIMKEQRARIETEFQFESRMGTIFKQLVQEEKSIIVNTLTQSWPGAISFDHFEQTTFVRIEEVWPSLQVLLGKWRTNLILDLYINKIKSAFLQLKSATVTIPEITNQFLNNKKAPFMNNKGFKLAQDDERVAWFESGLVKSSDDSHFTHKNPIKQVCPFKPNDDQIQQHMVNQIQESWDAYNNCTLNDQFARDAFVKQQHELSFYYKDKLNAILREIEEDNSSNIVLQHLLPRPTPTHLLQSLLINPHPLIGAYAVILTYIQQCKRCIKYAMKDMRSHIYKESSFQFKPAEHPNWVLLQLEMNVMFRKDQVDIALNLKDIMQLQMGEGKTSCILPMLASLARNKICQIVVLKSLYVTNYELLKYKLGYLINKHVLTFPCHRLIEMTPDKLTLLYSKYEQCLANKNVIITTPEYVQSFGLKCIEMCYKESKKSEIFIKISKFLEKNIYSVLDESDEILHYKHQLVYTVGVQEGIDGGAERYMTIEKVFLYLYRKGFQTLYWSREDYKKESRVLVEDIVRKNWITLPEHKSEEMMILFAILRPNYNLKTLLY